MDKACRLESRRAFLGLLVVGWMFAGGTMPGPEAAIPDGEPDEPVVRAVAAAGRLAQNDRIRLYLPSVFARAPAPSVLERIGTLGGQTSDLAVEGNRLYLAQGSTVEVYDLTDPTGARLIARSVSLRGLVLGLMVDPRPEVTVPIGPDVEDTSGVTRLYALVSAPYPLEPFHGTSLVVLELDSHARPIEVGRTSWSSRYEAFEKPVMRIHDRTLCFMLRGRSGVSCFDLSDSRRPRRIDMPEALVRFGPESLDLADGYLHVAEDEGLSIYDVRAPRQVMPVAEFERPGAKDVVVRAGIAYLAVAEHSWIPAAIDAIDVSRPMEPQRIGSFELAADPSRLLGDDRFLFVLRHGAPWVLDISRPTDLRLAGDKICAQGSCQLSHRQYHMTGDRLYAVDDSALRIYDRNGPTIGQSIQMIPALRVWSPQADSFLHHAGELAISDSKLFAASEGSSGFPYLASVNLAQPALAKADVMTLGGQALSSGQLVAEAGLLYMAGSHLEIFDVEDLSKIRRIGSIPVNGSEFGHHGLDLALHDGMVSVAHQGGVEVFDVSDPQQPRSLLRYQIEDTRDRRVVAVDDHGRLFALSARIPRVSPHPGPPDGQCPRLDVFDLAGEAGPVWKGDVCLAKGNQSYWLMVEGRWGILPYEWDRQLTHFEIREDASIEEQERRLAPEARCTWRGPYDTTDRELRHLVRGDRLWSIVEDDAGGLCIAGEPLFDLALVDGPAFASGDLVVTTTHLQEIAIFRRVDAH